MVLCFHIQYEQVSSAHLQAHNHLGHRLEDEESICKPAHQDILQKETTSLKMRKTYDARTQ